MKIFRLGVFIFLVYLLQVAVVSRFAIFSVRPDLMLVVITLIAVTQGVERGFASGFLGGLMQDVLGGMYFINFLTKGLLGFLVGTFKESIFGSEESVAVTAVLVATVTEFVLQVLILSLFFDKPVATPLSLFLLLVISSVFNCAIAPILYPLIRASAPYFAEE